MQVIKINNSPYDANAYLVNGTILIDVEWIAVKSFLNLGNI